MALDLGTLVGYLMMDTSKYDGPLDESSQKTDNFARNAPGWMAGAAAGIIASAALIGTALFGIGAEFDSTADTIAIKTGATGAEFQGLVDSADNVGSRVPVSLDKIAPALATLNSRMGLTGDELETVGTQVLNLGRMIGEDLNLDAATGAFNNFHLSGAEASGALDFLLQTSQRTGIGVNDLIAQVAAAAPITQQLGFTFAETAGMIGTMDQAGLDSGAMIAAMKKGLSELTQPGESAQDAFKRVTGELEGFIASGDDASAMDLAATVFGTRGAPQFIAALKDGSLNMDDLTAGAELSGQKINDLAAQTDDFGETWQLLVNNAMIALKPIAEEVFGFVSTALEQVADNIGPAFSWIAENSQLLANFGAVALSFAAAFFIVQGAITAYNVIMGIYQAVTTAGSVAQWLLNVAMTANPIGIIVVAVGLLIAAIVLLIMNWDTVIKFLGDAWNGFVGWFVGVMEGFAGWWTGVWDGFIGFVEDVWTGFVGWLGEVLNNIVNLFLNWTLIGIIIQYWDEIVSFITDTWNGFVGWITDSLNMFFLGWSIIWNSVSNFIAGVWSNITSGVTATWNGILSFLGGIPNAIFGFFAGAGKWLYNIGRDILNGLWDGLVSIWNGLVGWITDIGQQIADTFAGVLGIHSPSTVFRAFGINIGEGLMEGFADVGGDVNEGVSDLVNVPATERATMSSSSTTYGGSRTVIMEASRSTLDEEAIYAALGSPRLGDD